MSHPDSALRPHPALLPGTAAPDVSPGRAADARNPRGAAYPAWLRPAVRDASQMDLPYDPVFLDSSLSGTTLLTVLSRLGADVELRDVAIGWHACSKGRSSTHELAPGLRREDPDCEVDDFEGVFRFTLDGRPWVGGRVAVEGRLKPFLKTILGGPSLAALLELEGRLREVEADLRADELQVFGSRLAIGEIPEVAESDLVLPRALMETMLSVLARFEREAGRAEPRRVVRSRGLLMMGRPGTGKTLTIGHILGRLAGCRRYLFVPAAVAELNTPGRRFEDLIRHIGAHPSPAVVVVEDIDRLFHAGTVTPQYFLNVLDGMLRPGAPTLWIATCNDPSGLPENLTDRPGRFDRILVFENPGLEERMRLLRLYAREALGEAVLAALARDADGLTGAHIAEACGAAEGGDGEDAGDGAAYAGRLAAEVEALRQQQGAAERYGRRLRGGAVGF